MSHRQTSSRTVAFDRSVGRQHGGEGRCSEGNVDKNLFRRADPTREAVYVEAGRDAVIAGRGTRVGHHYEPLGTLRGQQKRLEPVPVTVIDTSKVSPPFRHPGTKILYMFEDVTVYGHGESEYTLRRNDSLLLDGEGLHGPLDLVRLPIKFLAVTAYPIITRTEPASTSKCPLLQGALQCHSPPN